MDSRSIGEYKIEIVPVILIEPMWPEIREFLPKVIELGHGEITEESIKNRALTSRSRIIIVTKDDKIVCVSTVEVVWYDSGLKSLLIPVVGGEGIHEWGPEWIKFIEALAKDLGCTELRGIAARNGWMRLLKERGWKENHVVITYPLEQ